MLVTFSTVSTVPLVTLLSPHCPMQELLLERLIVLTGCGCLVAGQDETEVGLQAGGGQHVLVLTQEPARGPVPADSPVEGGVPQRQALPVTPYHCSIVSYTTNG